MRGLWVHVFARKQARKKHLFCQKIALFERVVPLAKSAKKLEKRGQGRRTGAETGQRNSRNVHGTPHAHRRREIYTAGSGKCRYLPTSPSASLPSIIKGFEVSLLVFGVWQARRTDRRTDMAWRANPRANGAPSEAAARPASAAAAGAAAGARAKPTIQAIAQVRHRSDAWRRRNRCDEPTHSPLPITHAD